MSEINTEKNEVAVKDAAPNTEPFFGVQRVFLKGTSLEIPNGGLLFEHPVSPDLTLNLQADSKELASGIFEVTLTATLTGELDKKPIFLLEVAQAGIFEVRNLPDENIRMALEVGAPSILAPYLRAQLSTTLSHATLPIFLLPEINWQGISEQRRAAAAQQNLLH